jgi:hypothetical protein
MKIVEFILEFIFGMIKRGITLVTVCILIMLTMWIFTVVMPENAMNALEVFKAFFST